MNISYKERQITLFPDAAQTPDESVRPHFTAARLTLGVENLVILTIVSIMVILFAFAIGVERGKGIALKDIGHPSASGRSASFRDPGTAPAPAKPFWSMFQQPAAEADSASQEETRRAPAAAPHSEAVAVVAKAESSEKDDSPTVRTGAAFTVQIASYKTEKSAQIEAGNLKKRGYEDVFTMQKGNHVILCVGNFQKKEEASLFGKKLMGRYQDLIVRSL